MYIVAKDLNRNSITRVWKSYRYRRNKDMVSCGLSASNVSRIRVICDRRVIAASNSTNS